MTMYSSVIAEHFEGTADYDCRLHGEECYGCAYEVSIYTPYAQHNEPNRCLVAFREDVRLNPTVPVSHLALIWQGFAEEWPADQRDHAMRVFERLAV